jgi:hypothetical protein
MKKSLFLYLFIISVLMNLFTYAFYSKQSVFESERFASTKKKLKDSISDLSTKLNDAEYFSLEKNDNAQNYLENYDVNKLIPVIQEKLMAYNDNSEGNQFTGQVKMGDQKFIINKIKVINHRWIVADYSNGELWGEVVLKYFINKDESISFEIMDTYLYPKRNF